MRCIPIMLMAAVLLAGPALAQNPVIQFIHNSPSASLATVDIYLNGGASPIVDDLEFRTATNLIDLPGTGNFTFGIAPGNSTVVLVAKTSMPLMRSGTTLTYCRDESSTDAASAISITGAVSKPGG